MTVTSVETRPLRSGDMVRVSDESGTLPGKIGTLDLYDTYSGWLVRPTDGTYADYVRTANLTLVTTTEDKVNDLAAMVILLTTERDNARKFLTDFKARVRREAASIAEDDSDLYEPFNSLMAELGLEELEREFEVEVKFRGSYTVTVTATSEDDARNQVGTDDVKQYVAEDPFGNVIDDISTEVE